MRILITLLLAVLFNTVVKAQYKPDDKASSVQFTISNLGFDVKGKFTSLQGTINFDEHSPATASMDITIDAATVNTDNSLRDKHLQEDSYFNVKNYPSIRFVSAKITQAGKAGTYIMNGKLTIKHTTKDITFPFTVTPGSNGLVFKGAFKINRKDFGVGGTSTIGNELTVELNVVGVRS